MTPSQLDKVLSIFGQLCKPRSTETVSQYCERVVVFNEPKCSGPFSFAGREYLKEPLDNFGNDEVNDQVCCMATRTGKTRVFYGGLAWIIEHEPSRVLFVKPKKEGAAGARDDAKTRFIPMVRATSSLAEKIPGGLRRFDFSTSQQIIGGTIIDWTGSNSVGALASNPCNIVLQDEVDKFNTTRKKDETGQLVEADASALADERAKEFSNPKRFKASTPTLASGIIWQELLKSDFRRYFMPCPHCKGEVVFAWSKAYTVIDKTGKEAYVRWDNTARKKDGSWDLDKVEATAHAECPHCKGKIIDADKAIMICAGRWVATRVSSRRGYHLPAMYSAHRACNFGVMARRFLESVSSLQGPRNFINSDLAEPFNMQGASIDRKGLVGKLIEVTGEWLKILSADFHENAPYFWAVVRAWNGTNKSHGIEYQSFNQWTDLDELQAKHKIIKEAVVIDTGFSQSQVLQECANIKMPTRCVLGESVQGTAPECRGWTPAKAFGTDRLFRDEASGLFLPYRLKKDVDPYAGTELAKRMRIELLEFLNNSFEDMLDNIRSGKTGLEWTISKEMDTEEYHRHMSGKVRKYNKGKYKWDSRAFGWPDHVHSCELNNFVLAYRLQLISFDAIQTKANKEQEKNESATVQTS